MLAHVPENDIRQQFRVTLSPFAARPEHPDRERQTYRIPTTAIARIKGIRVVLNIGGPELERLRTS